MLKYIRFHLILVKTGNGFYDYAMCSAQFHKLVGVNYDQYQYMYLVDQLNYAVRCLDQSSYSYTVAGNGGQGYNNGIGLSAQFSTSSFLAVTSDGTTIYLADTGNNVIRKIKNTGLNRCLFFLLNDCFFRNQCVWSPTKSNVTTNKPTN